MAFFKTFPRDFFTFVLLNTVYEEGMESGGMTYYDLQSIDGIPKSKVYRQLKKLHERGLLSCVEEEGNVPGRPRHVYSLSTAGKAERLRLHEKLSSFFDEIKKHHPEYIEDVDIKEYLSASTFHEQDVPYIIERVLNDPEMSGDEKINRLQEMRDVFALIVEELGRAMQRLQGNN